MSPRQTDILMLVAADRSDKEIAVALGISRRTVRTHLERFYRTHSVHSRAAAVARWLILQRDTYPQSVGHLTEATTAR